jgi:hypothetical protein
VITLTVEKILNYSRIPPNTISAAEKVRWLNQVQRQLFRDYPLPESVYRFDTVAGVAIYPLPDDCPEDRITKITVGGYYYPFQAYSEEAGSYFWTIVAGQLMIYPTPETSGTEILIYCAPRPNELSESNLNAVPNFPEDYHELLVYGLAKRIAQARQDVALVNNFEADYQELAREANKEFKKQRPKQVLVLR